MPNDTALPSERAVPGDRDSNESKTDESKENQQGTGNKGGQDEMGGGAVSTKPSSGLPDLVVAQTGATPTAHLVVAEPAGAPTTSPHRVSSRGSCRPQHRWSSRCRGNEIAMVIAKNFAPLAMRQVRQMRSGALPIDAFAAPLRKTFEDLGGTFMKFGQLVASSPGVFGEDVSDEFRACLDTGPAVDFHAHTQPDRGRPRNVGRRRLRRDRSRTGRAGIDRSRAPCQAPRREDGRGQDPPSADTPCRLDGPRHAPTAARADRTPNGGREQPDGCCRCSTGSASRLARSSTCATRPGR